jgi:hypothetical protein
VNDAITVALIVVAIGMRQFGVAASERIFYAHRVGGEHGESLAALGLVHRRDAEFAEKNF